MSIINHISKKKLIAVLIDPEKNQHKETLDKLVSHIQVSNVDFVFVGGSTVTEDEFALTIDHLKKNISLPIIIFPGSSHQISDKADGILLLNLISGRNPDFLIGHHINAAQKIATSDLEVISTSYLLIDGGSHSSVAYISQTTPIPQHQISISYKTALAGKLIGHKALFLDAGSGAKESVSLEIVREMKKLNQPLIVGGGIRSIEQIEQLHENGVNVVVIGNKIEEDLDFLLDIRNYKMALI